MTTPDPPILPTVGGVVGAGKDRLVAVMPAAEAHVDAGEWSILVTGLRGQYGVASRALADEVMGSSLGTATGPALTAIAASNFDTPAQPGATAAVGEVTFARVVIHNGPGPTFNEDILIDATEQGYFVDLVALLSHYLSGPDGHASSVFDPVSGVGAHIVTDSSIAALDFWTPGDYGSYVYAANYMKSAINRHFSNQRISNGDTLLAHQSEDVDNLITLDDVTAANPAGWYGTQTADETAALFALANACKVAFLAHIHEESHPGVIRSGLLVDLAAVPTASPPVQAAQYRVTRDVYLRSSTLSVDVPVEATRAGTAFNIPQWATNAPALSLTARGAPFDSTLLPVAIRAAGGGTGQPDATLAEAARAAWTGAYGPTISALRAGALRGVGVVRAVPREDLETGRAWVYPIDASWSQSARWTSAIEQILRGTGADDEWLGLGCRESVGAVSNRLVRIELTVQLRSIDYIPDTEAITARIVGLLRSYFDDRPDFWAWRYSALRGLVSGADRRRVLSCPSVIVRDYSGTIIAEPVEPTAGATLTHWWLADGAVIVEYTAPS